MGKRERERERKRNSGDSTLELFPLLRRGCKEEERGGKERGTQLPLSFLRPWASARMQLTAERKKKGEKLERR